MAEELAVVYVPIVPETSKIAPGVRSALGGAAKYAERDGAGIGSKLSTGIGKTLKTGAVATGAAVAGVLGAAMTKGFQRLTAIDSAEAKLSGLGHTAGSVSSIMDDALASVKGTAFGLGDAASAAASAVASGVKPGKDLQRTLKLMGDAAAIAGTDLGSMAGIFNKVAASGKLQGDVLAQLGDAGIPIIQLLAQEMGVTAGEITKLAAEGKIGFDELRNAIETGMGGAALAAGQTFSGAMDNAGAALGRLGAAALEPFFDDARDGVVGFTGVIDNLTDRVGPAAQALRDWLGPAAGSVVGFVRDLRAEATSLGPVMSNTTSTFSLLLDTALSLAPSIATITTELLKVTGAISVATWQTLLSVLTGTAAVADATLVPALNVLAGVLESSELASLAFGAALLGLVKGKAILDGLGKAAGGIKTAVTTLSDYGTAMKEVSENLGAFTRAHPEMTKLGAATKFLGDSGHTSFAQITAGADSARQRVAAFGDAHRLAAMQAKAQALASTDAFTAIDRMGSQAWHGTVAAASDATRGMATAVGGLKGTVVAAFTGMKGAATGILNAMGGPWGVAMAGAAIAVGAITAAYGEAKQSADNLARAASSAIEAQKELAREVAGTTGAIGEEGMAAATKLATARLEEFHESSAKARGFQGFFRDLALATGLTTKAFQENQMAARENEDTYNVLRDTAQGMGMTMDDVATAAAEGSPKYHQLRQALEDLGYNGEEATRMLEGWRAEQQKLVDQARQISPAQAEVSAAIQDIADKAGNAETRVENYWAALQKLSGNAPGLTEANANLRAELDQLTGQFTVAEGEVSEFAGATLNASGQLDTLNNTASGAVFNAMNDLGQRMREAAIAGGDANDIWAAAQPALQGLADSSGLGRDAIMQLAEQMNMTPRDLLISAQVAADPALAQANALKTQIETVPKVVGSKIELTGGPEAMQVFDDVGIKFKMLDEEAGIVEITAVADDAMAKLDDIIGKKVDLDSLPPSSVEALANTRDAQAALDDIARQLGEVDGTTASPTLDVDPISFNDGMVGANGQLDAFDFRFVNATADLDTMPLDWNAGLAHGTITGVDDRHALASSDLDNLLLGVNAGVAHGTLDGVAGRRPLPVSDLLNDPLNVNAGAAHGTLNVLDSDRPKPIADLHTQPLRDGVTDSRNWLQRLIDDFGNFALNVRLNVVRSIRDIFSSEGGNAAGGTIGALASGGSILDLRRGGQLPTYGPGSNVVDGFLGIDSQGSPIVRVDAGEEVVNAKQSAKHRTFIKALNRGDRRAEQAAELTGLETGGTIGSREGLDRALREAKSSHDIGARYQWGGISREAADCSGFVGRVAWAAQGRDPDRAGRMGTTDTMLAGRWPGFRPGRQGPFIVGVNSAHMAATIDGIPVESGGDVGGPSVGEGDGANDPQFSQWYSLAHDFFSPPYANKPSITESSESLEYGESGSRVTSTTEGDGRAVALSPEASAAAESGSNDKDSPFYGTGSDSWSGLAGNLASAFVSGQVASLLSVLGISDQLPPIMKAGKTWYQQVEDDATPQEIQRQDEAIAQTAEPDAVAASTADSGAAAAVVDPASATYATPQEAAKAALRPRGWDTGANWAGVDFIYRKESDWNPLAENPSSGAWGLPQLNPASGTLQQYLPDKSPDPFKQTQAGAQYIEDRYGDPVEAEKFWRANNWYDRGGRANGVGHMLKNTLEPERVLSPDQTRAFEDLVYGQLPDLSGLAESLTKAAVSGAAGPAAGMANAVVPGSGAVVSAAAGPAGELAGWYAGEVAGNVQYAAEEFGRDLMAIPTSMLDSITDVVMPAMPQMPQWQMPLMPELPQEPANRGAAADRRGRYGNGDVHFHVRDDQDAYMKGRLLAMREHRGLIGV